VNLWAVVVAALANMVIGSLWYGPLLGKQWKKLQGFTDEKMRSMPLSAKQAMLGGLLTALVMAYVLAHFVSLLDIADALGAWQLAFWAWLGLIATTQAGSFLWEGRPFKLFALNTLQSLVSLFAMTLILTLWM